MIFSTRSIIGMIFGRLIAGYSYGCAYIGLIVYAAEISTKYNRGKLTALMHLGLTLGVLIFTVIIPFTAANEEFGIIIAIGVISGVLSLIALVINHFFTYESPVALIIQDLDSDAQESLVKLRSEKYITNDIRENFQSIKDMVTRDLRYNGTIYKIPTFYFLLLLKLIAIVVFSYPVNVTRLNLAKSTIVAFYGYNLQSLLLALVRTLISIAVVFVVDVTGRRLLMTWSIRISALLGFALAISFAASAYNVATVFNFGFELSSSFGILMIVDIYSGEAFTTSKKGIGLSLVNCFENLLHIILIFIGVLAGIEFVVSVVFLFITAAVLLIGGFISYPETKKMSLVEATKRFLGIKLNVHLC